jgi:hypothetical protein
MTVSRDAIGELLDAHYEAQRDLKLSVAEVTEIRRQFSALRSDVRVYKRSSIVFAVALVVLVVILIILGVVR